MPASLERPTRTDKKHEKEGNGMPDNKKVPMTPEERNDAVQVIHKLHDQTMFLAQLLNADAVGESEANVHMSLMRQSYDDLAALLRTDAISKELDETHALCRKANARVRELEAQLGKSVTAEAAMSRLKALTDWFATWWELSGFHYMETTWLQWGIQFRSSYEIDHRDTQGTRILFGDKELAMQVGPVVPYLFDEIDLRKDTHHDELKLTSLNVTKLQEKITAVFPGFRFTGCTGRMDHDEMLMELNGIVPWADVEAWRDKALAEAAKLPPRNTGKYFVELAGLERSLNNKRETTDWPKSLILKDRDRLNYLQVVCGLWTTMQDFRRGRPAIEDDLTLNWVMDGKIYSKFFKSGTKYDTMASWIAKEFALDVKADLIGVVSDYASEGSGKDERA